MAVLRPTGFLILFSTVALAQDERKGREPTFVVAPMYINNNKTLMAQTAEIGADFHAALESLPLSVCSEFEAKAADDKLRVDRRQRDYHRTNAALADFARTAKAMYGIDVYLTVDLDEKARLRRSILKASIRVVLSDDGSQVRIANGSRTKKSGETFRDVFRALSTELLAELALPGLHGVVEALPPAPVAPPMVLVPPSPSPEEIRGHPPVPPQELVKKEDGSTQRLLGKIGVIGGAGVAVAGAVLMGLSAADNSRLTPAANGSLPIDQKPTVQAALAKQGAGIGLAIGGVIVAGVGAALWLWSPSAPLSVTAGPMQSGAGVYLGKSLP